MILASLLQPNWKLCVRKIRLLLFSDYILYLYIHFAVSICLYCFVGRPRRTTISKKKFFFCISALNVQKYATEPMPLIFFSTCYNNKTFLSKLSLCVKTYDCILLTWWCWWNRTCTMNILGVKDQRLSGW